MYLPGDFNAKKYYAVGSVGNNVDDMGGHVVLT